MGQVKETESEKRTEKRQMKRKKEKKRNKKRNKNRVKMQKKKTIFSFTWALFTKSIVSKKLNTILITFPFFSKKKKEKIGKSK